MFNLSGEVALITGASGGIGEAIARFLHSRGAAVILHGTNEKKLSEIADSLMPGAFVITADLSDREKVAQLYEGVQNIVGPPSILVNNAGITRDSMLVRMKDKHWDEVLDVNLTASMTLMRAAIRPMLKARYGRIISISSIVGVLGNHSQTNYAASKAGLIGMSKSLASESASRGVTVNVIAPGYIKTAMTEVLPDEVKESFLVHVPMNRPGDPKEVAAAALFLASREASYITGSVINVNGGMVML